MIAYAPYDLTIVDLANQNGQMQRVTGPADDICWSADGRRLAVDQSLGSTAIASLGNSDPTVIQGVPPKTVGNLIGWIDSAHVAVTDIAN